MNDWMGHLEALRVEKYCIELGVLVCRNDNDSMIPFEYIGVLATFGMEQTHGRSNASLIIHNPNKSAYTAQ